MRHLAVKRPGKFGSGFADQIGFPNPRKELAQTADPAGFRLPTRNPEDVMKARKCFGCGVGICRFRIIDEQYVALAANLLHPMSQAGKSSQAFSNSIRIAAERDASGKRAGGILGIV